MKDWFLEGEDPKSIRSICFKNCTFSNTTAPKNCHNSNLLMMQDFLTSTSNARAHNVGIFFYEIENEFLLLNETFFLFLILKIEKYQKKVKSWMWAFIKKTLASLCVGKWTGPTRLSVLNLRDGFRWLMDFAKTALFSTHFRVKVP